MGLEGAKTNHKRKIMPNELTTTEQQLFTPRQETAGAMVQAAVSRAAAEVQAAMVIAKRFPRDENAAMQRILQACSRKSLAEEASYSFPRGGSTVSGPSIQLARVIAQAWGNIDFGITEADQRDGESTMIAYCWDLETNARECRTFQVKHERRVGRGERFRIDRLTDPRDIYEMTANQGARRLRACILGIIPGDVIAAAEAKCEQTIMQAEQQTSMTERVGKLVEAFKEFGVTAEQLSARLGKKLEAVTAQEIINLRKIFRSLRDGMAKPDEFFDPAPTKPDFSQAKANAEKTADEKAEAAMGLAPSAPPPPTTEPAKRGPGRPRKEPAQTTMSAPADQTTPPAPAAVEPLQKVQQLSADSGSIRSRTPQEELAAILETVPFELFHGWLITTGFAREELAAQIKDWATVPDGLATTLLKPENAPKLARCVKLYGKPAEAK